MGSSPTLRFGLSSNKLCGIERRVLVKRICVLGLGYIGLPTAAMLATHGFAVIGVDVNQDVVDVLLCLRHRNLV